MRRNWEQKKWATDLYFSTVMKWSVIPGRFLLYFVFFFPSLLSPLNTNSLSSSGFATDAGRFGLKWLSEPDPTGQLSSNTPTWRCNQSRGWGWGWGWGWSWRQAARGTDANRTEKLIPALGPSLRSNRQLQLEERRWKVWLAVMSRDKVDQGFGGVTCDALPGINSGNSLAPNNEQKEMKMLTLLCWESDWHLQSSELTKKYLLDYLAWGIPILRSIPNTDSVLGIGQYTVPLGK